MVFDRQGSYITDVSSEEAMDDTRKPVEHLDFWQIRTAYSLRDVTPYHDAEAWPDDESDEQLDPCECGCSHPARVNGKILCGYCVAYERKVEARLERDATIKADVSIVIHKTPEV